MKEECREPCVVPFSDFSLQISKEILYGVSGQVTDNISNVVHMGVWYTGQFLAEIKGYGISGDINRPSEFVCAGEGHFSR